MIGALWGLAFGLVVAWPQEIPVLAPLRGLVRRLTPTRAWAGVARGLALAVPTLVITRWPVAAAVAVLGGHGLQTSAERRKAETTRRAHKVAVAAWTDTLRDLTLAGHNVEEALGRAARLAVPPLGPLLREAEIRREYAGYTEALHRLGESLDDRDADLVIMNLIRAADGRAHNLAEVLGTLGVGIRRAVAVEEEIEAARARPRRSVSWAVGIFVFLGLGMATLAREGLGVFYGTVVGQAVLAGLVGWFAIGLRAMVALASPIVAQRVFGAPASTPKAPAWTGAWARGAVVAGAAAVVVLVGRGAVEFVGWATNAGAVGAAAVTALLGISALWFKDAVSPPPPPFRRTLARLEAPAEAVRPADSAQRAVQRAGDALGIPARIRAKRAVELRLVGETLEQHLARRFAGFAVGVLILPAAAAFAFAVGVALPASVPVWISPALGVAGFLQPGRSLARRAEERRASLTYALVSFLYAAGAAMKSGLSREDAIEEAAGAGEGWAFEELRAAEYEAWAHDEDVAVGFDRLGEKLASDDLRAIAESLAAGADSGAPIADALITKAESMQTSVLAQTRNRAAKATEDMDAVAMALVMMPIVAFLTIPAVVQGTAI